MRVVKIDKETTENILSDLLKRSPNQYDSYADSVQEILNAVKERGTRRSLTIQRSLTDAG